MTALGMVDMVDTTLVVRGHAVQIRGAADSTLPSHCRKLQQLLSMEPGSTCCQRRHYTVAVSRACAAATRFKPDMLGCLASATAASTWATAAEPQHLGLTLHLWDACPTQLDGSKLDGQPLATPDDCLLAEAIARDDPQVQQLVAARGVSFSKVACDPWAIHACPDEWMNRRLMQVYLL